MRVLVAGGGFAGVEAVLALGALAADRVEIGLVSASDSLHYRPQTVREPFGLGEAERIALAPLCEAHEATLHVARVTGVDVARRTVATDAAGALGFDVLIVATGARAEPAVPGAITFDGTDSSVAAMRRLLERARSGDARRIAFVAPAGAMWTLPLYELAFLTQRHLSDEGVALHLDIVTPEGAPLEVFGATVSDRLRRALAARGIALRRPEHLADLRADAVVALPRIAGPRLAGLPADAGGFVPVDEFGRVRGAANVYAAGDVSDRPVKQGGLAAQQAEVAAAHVAATAGAPLRPRPFTPELRALLLTGGVPWHLLGGPQPHAVTRPLWPSRGKVVGTRLARYLGIDEPADRPEGIELALMLADDAAAHGDAGTALEWLSAAKAIGATLPHEYERKQLAWALGSDQ